MNQIDRYIGANDNSPAWAMTALSRGRRPIFRFNARPIVSKPNRLKSLKRPSRQTTPVEKATPKHSFETLAWIAPVFALVAWFTLIASGAPVTKYAAYIAILGLGLLLWAVRSDRRNALRSKQFSILAATAFLVTSVTGFAAQSGLYFFTTDLAVLTAIVAAVLATVFRSGPALMLSVMAGAIWLICLVPTFNEVLGLGPFQSEGWMPLYLVLLLAQITLANGLKQSSALALIILCSYSTVSILLSRLVLSHSALVGLGFICAVAHYRAGKSWSDVDAFGARLHTLTGWIAALFCAFHLQSLWLDPSWLAVDQPVPIFWWIGFATAILAITLASIQRYKHAHITLIGIVLLSLAAAGLPLAAAFPASVGALFETVPGLSAQPGFGLVIGAGIMASGLGWIVNGLRKTVLLDMILGVCVVGIQALILLGPLFGQFDLGVVFIMSLIVALCVSGLIVGAGLDESDALQKPV